MNAGARPSVLRGELVREEPICLKCSEGLARVNAGARPSVLRGELVRVNVGARPSMLRGELVRIAGRSPSVCNEVKGSPE